MCTDGIEGEWIRFCSVSGCERCSPNRVSVSEIFY
jgi:hypothetical protein